MAPVSPNVLVVIQARLGSTRLPGKVLLPLNEKSVLQWVVERAQRAGYPVVVACPPKDHAALLPAAPGQLRSAVLPEVAEADVLGRFVRAIDPDIDLVVRLTADCPCVDPALIREAVQAVTRGHDYAGNTRVRTYPRGLDVEAFTVDQLMRTHRQAKSPYDREHVTPFMQVSANRPYDMKHTDISGPPMDERWRWVLDTHQDYEWLQGAFNALGDPTTVALADYSRLHPPPRD